MIGRLKGIIESSGEDSALIDVHGVGYEVFCSARTLAALAPGEAAELVIETHVREDHIHLYGFANASEREWFRLLTSVQRVGAKMALAILGAHTPDTLATAIAAKDTTAFSRISGIGPKLAERIVAELKDKAVDRGSRIADRSAAVATRNSQPTNRALDDALSALIHLGYGRSEAYAAAAKAAKGAGENASLDQIIKQSLKELTHA